MLPALGLQKAKSLSSAVATVSITQIMEPDILLNQKLKGQWVHRIKLSVRVINDCNERYWRYFRRASFSVNQSLESVLRIHNETSMPVQQSRPLIQRPTNWHLLFSQYLEPSPRSNRILLHTSLRLLFVSCSLSRRFLGRSPCTEYHLYRYHDLLRFLILVNGRYA